MREILFRGKTLGGEWVQGYYIKATHHWHNHGIHEDWIATDTIQNGGRCNVRGKYAVIPESVSEFTGLTDKNGKKIFEGDIVKCADTTYDYSFIAVVMFGNPNGEYNWGFQLKRIRGAGANTDILLWADMEETGACIEVIGNIHGNPELLKGENNA